MRKTYTELLKFPTYEERLAYCSLLGQVGNITFGGSRWVNQALYSSEEWKSFRGKIIVRDAGCDLAMPGFDISRYGVIHHLNPITKEDVVKRNPCVFDPDNVILVASDTHRQIHYGHHSSTIQSPIERRPNDTCPWR